MKNNELFEFIKNTDFDIAEPSGGHQARFLNKLKDQQNPGKSGKLRMLWTPLLAIAACFLVIFMVTEFAPGGNSITNAGELANISPEMKETQEFYTTLIKTELAKVNSAKSPETEAVVNDALAQLEKLDLEYDKLKKDLVKSGQDNRVVFAMISNLQQRIDVLNNVLNRIDKIHELKNISNENNII